MALPLQGWVSLGKMPPLGLPSSPLRLVLGKPGQLWTPVQGLGPGSVAAHIFTQNLQKDTLHSVPVHTAVDGSFLQSCFFKWFLAPPSLVHSLEALPRVRMSVKTPRRGSQHVYEMSSWGLTGSRGRVTPPASAHTLCEHGPHLPGA